jgi:hypothetical protein
MSKSLPLAVLIVGLGVIACVPLAVSQASKSGPGYDPPCPQQRKLEDEQKFKDFVVRTYRGERAGGCFQILRAGTVVFSKNAGERVVIGNDINIRAATDTKHAPAIPIGTDITGSGSPELLLVDWGGGAHCCFTFHIIELGDRVRETAKIDAGDSDYAHFEDVNQDGKYEFVGWDFTFNYWHASFAESPAPRIVLQFNGKTHELAPELMRQPAPSSGDLESKSVDVRKMEWADRFPPPLLWRTMLDLIYTGHSDLAWQFATASWKPENIAKQAFLDEFCGQLAGSPYFDQLRPTIQNAPCILEPKKGVN